MPYIDDRLMVSSFVVWMMMKQSRHLKKFIQEFVVLTNLVPSFIFESNEWVIIGPPWSRIAWITQKKKCSACQFHANFIHQPPEPLHPTVASWPFNTWGLDVVGPLTPKSSDGHSYILAATDYFSKWAEVTAFREVKKETVVNFIREMSSINMACLVTSSSIMGGSSTIS